MQEFISIESREIKDFSINKRAEQVKGTFDDYVQKSQNSFYRMNNEKCFRRYQTL